MSFTIRRSRLFLLRMIFSAQWNRFTVRGDLELMLYSAGLRWTGRNILGRPFCSPSWTVFPIFRADGNDDHENVQGATSFGSFWDDNIHYLHKMFPSVFPFGSQLNCLTHWWWPIPRIFKSKADFPKTDHRIGRIEFLDVLSDFDFFREMMTSFREEKCTVLPQRPLFLSYDSKLV